MEAHSHAGTGTVWQGVYVGWVDRTGPDEGLWLGNVKLMLDGTLQGFTARVMQPGYYGDQPNRIRNVTLGAAYMLKMDHALGSIEAGKFADLAVLEQGPHAADLTDHAVEVSGVGDPGQLASWRRSLRSWDPGRPRVHEPPRHRALPMPRAGDDPGYPACLPQWLHQLRTSTQGVGRGGGHRSGGIRAGPQRGGRSSQRALRVQRGGGTPRPPRDSALGPTNNELDRERSGEGAVDKVVLIGLAVVVAPFTVLAIIGRVIGFF